MGPRKGGGRKAFLKGVKADSDSDAEQSTQAAPAKQAPKPSAPQPSKADAFKISTPLPPLPVAPSAPAAVIAAAAATGALDGDSDGDGVPTGAETRGQLVQRHKREFKALKEKHKKLGKKYKEEAVKEERDMEERHAAELAALEGKQGADKQVAEVADSLYAASIDADAGAPPPKKQTKAQRQRQKRAQRDAEREARIAAELADMPESERVAEEKALKRLLQPLGLRVHEIKADGHCLYNAVAHQLRVHEAATVPDVSQLRGMAAAQLQQHRDDFLPFMEEDLGEGAEAEARFAEYCDEVANTAAWGGNLELKALALALQRPIHVHSVCMPTVELGAEYAGAPLVVCYQRHAYGLGEHYNSVVPGVPSESESEESQEETATGPVENGGAAADDSDEEGEMPRLGDDDEREIGGNKTKAAKNAAAAAAARSKKKGRDAGGKGGRISRAGVIM